MVHLHVSAEGTRDGSLQRLEFVRSYYPMDIDEERWRAIAWTTSASACAVVKMVKDGKLPGKGFIRQEEIPLDAFLRSETGRLFEA